MDEELHLGREVVMDHIFEKWDIKTSSSQICDNEHADPLFAELEELIFTGALVH